MTHTIALYGGDFNPPGFHHRTIVEEIADYFDEVIIIPSGPRADKPRSHIAPMHRAVMITATFSGIDNVTIDYSDLSREDFTRTFDLDRRFAERGERWHVVGSDLVVGGRRNESQIHGWYRGEEIWYNFNLAVVMRSGFPIAVQDVPPCGKVFTGVHFPMSSTLIRHRLAKGLPIKHLLVPAVEHYIKKNSLYIKRA
ncbi:nicotinate-nicotinamide nucleotide adenylyltransferase [Candidatus Uhrbacteria bacterium]|nr:nicotinate-nicotinamide nucleotide adenylyltransferase [Candidatus Uhrbacteria bacterium]